MVRSSKSKGANVCSPSAVGAPNGMMVTSGTVPRCPLIRYVPRGSMVVLRYRVSGFGEPYIV